MSRSHHPLVLGAHGIEILEEQENEGELVKEVYPQNDTPKSWMWSDERSIAEL